MPSNESMTINLQRLEPSQTLGALPEGQVHMYAVRHESARRWVDLSLHLSDLEVTLSWLELLVHKHTQRTPEADALWTAALTMFFKCFKRSASRSKLDVALILANEPEEGRAQFAVLQSLRDKTVVHDENAYTQGAVLVPIANPDGPVAKVGPPVVTLFKASTLDDGHISNLRLLTLASITYVSSAIAAASAEVEAYMCSASRADLVAAGPYLYTSPSVETVSRRRSD
ncbi:hypothetical protein [Pseudomonas sp. PD9R]|uniref:hypothetical protein n=1 Tax=Pseudomonas sp. PD9R TaxID=2853534 RepID=UPI001C461CAB|nr:hypothetical protein [Pseudomonas sp. PD9R]MBV6823202.1 hypothetical protein [Pseudomonas sp. PD9R]